MESYNHIGFCWALGCFIGAAIIGFYLLYDFVKSKIALYREQKRIADIIKNQPPKHKAILNLERELQFSKNLFESASKEAFDIISLLPLSDWVISTDFELESGRKAFAFQLTGRDVFLYRNPNNQVAILRIGKGEVTSNAIDNLLDGIHEYASIQSKKNQLDLSAKEFYNFKNSP